MRNYRLIFGTFTGGFKFSKNSLEIDLWLALEVESDSQNVKTFDVFRCFTATSCCFQVDHTVMDTTWEDGVYLFAMRVQSQSKFNATGEQSRRASFCDSRTHQAERDRFGVGSCNLKSIELASSGSFLCPSTGKTVNLT